MEPRTRTFSIARNLLLLQVIAVAWFMSGLGAAPKSSDPATLLMTINGRSVRQLDMDTLLQINVGPKFSALTAEQKETVRINRASETRGQLIDRVLLVTAAEADGLTASGKEIAGQLIQVKSQLPKGMTLDGYLKGVGVASADFKSYAAEQVLINKLSAKRTADIRKPSAQEVSNYHKQNPDYFAQKERAHVNHVLISTMHALNDKQRATKRAEAEVVRRRLLAASPSAFGEIASEVSNCPSKAHGGDLGLIEKGSMIAAFDAAAFSQEIGAIGRVIRTPKGYHVLKVTERVPAKKIGLTEAIPDIEALLLFKARDQAMEAYLRTLRLSAKVVVPQASKAKK